MFERIIYNAKNEKQVLDKIDEMNRFNLDVDGSIIDIVKDVEKNGDDALKRYTKKFDNADIDELKVRPKDIQKALSLVDKRLFKPMARAAKNIEKYHMLQRKNIKDFTFKNTGYTIKQRYLPVESAGIYIPGGQAPLFSTLLMAAIPARIAGVKRIVVVSPPRYKGEVGPYILAAADMLGITEIYRVGGAQAIAALAFGTKSIRKVDKVAGPGNIYSTMAKKYLFGRIGIDSLNGPSEITIIADRTANPSYIALDLLAQAEHINGHSLLITDNAVLADKVGEQIEKYGVSYSITAVIVKNMTQAVKLANYKAPEHLTIAAKNSGGIISKITGAPAIFEGNFTPVAFGDYMAGANHILPTNGTARFFSGLSVLDFLKHTHIVKCTKKAMLEFGEAAETLAEIETLTGHAASIQARRQL
jgi:histidinol dehydrogenase